MQSIGLSRNKFEELEIEAIRKMGEESTLRLTNISHPKLLTMSVLCFILEVIKWLPSQNLVNTLGGTDDFI